MKKIDIYLVDPSRAVARPTKGDISNEDTELKHLPEWEMVTLANLEDMPFQPYYLALGAYSQSKKVGKHYSLVADIAVLGRTHYDLIVDRLRELQDTRGELRLKSIYYVAWQELLTIVDETAGEVVAE